MEILMLLSCDLGADVIIIGLNRLINICIPQEPLKTVRNSIS